MHLLPSNFKLLVRISVRSKSRDRFRVMVGLVLVVRARLISIISLSVSLLHYQYQYHYYIVTLKGRKEGNVLFNDTLNTFYLQLYGVTHMHDMVWDHSDGERENPRPPHGLLFPIISKGSFICIIPQTG